ncbi:MAG: MFS family permease [Hyphomicrobiaceae bacterium]|jgi:MFS family permease
MIRAIVPVITLLVSTALLLMGNGLQGTLLPVRGDLEGFSPIALGILGSSYFVGFMAGCFGGPRVIARAGHVRAFAAAVAIASSVVLAHALTVNPAIWWILRAITGACFATLFMIIESWLNEKSTNEDRGLVFSLYTIIQLTVITLGQLMLMTAAPEDFPLFSVASILISLSAVPLALTRASVPEPIEATKIDFRGLYKASPIGLVGCLIVGLTNGSFWSLAPLFVQSGGGAAADVAIFMSATVIGGAVGQWPLGRLSDRIDRRRVIQAAGLGAAIAGASLAWSMESSTILVLASGVAYGVFAFPLYAISVAHTNDFVAPESYVQAASGLLLVFALGAVIGPLVASALIVNWGAESLFLFTAAVHAAFVIYVTARIPKRKRPAEDDRIAFAEAILVSTTTSTVDPLTPDSEETVASDSID